MRHTPGELVRSVSAERYRMTQDTTPALPPRHEKAEREFRARLTAANRAEHPVVTFDRETMNALVGVIDRLRVRSEGIAAPLGEAAAQPETSKPLTFNDLTDDQIVEAWDRWPKTSITSRAAAVSFVRHVLAAVPSPTAPKILDEPRPVVPEQIPQPETREVPADGPTTPSRNA